MGISLKVLVRKFGVKFVMRILIVLNIVLRLKLIEKVWCLSFFLIFLFNSVEKLGCLMFILILMRKNLRSRKYLFSVRIWKSFFKRFKIVFMRRVFL